MSYWFLVIITIILGFGTQAYIKHCYKKYSRVDAGVGMTGAMVARRMLDANGLQHVPIRCVSGTLSDHYDPKSRSINLSQGIYNSTSVAAMAVACHECGHAVQHATSYGPLKVRTALVPAVNIGSSAWLIILIIGIALNIMELFWLAIIVYAIVVVFHLVTLPVEFNASRRGLAYIKAGAGTGYALVPQVNKGARKVLTAAALTYVAAALTSILQLLYYIGMARR